MNQNKAAHPVYIVARNSVMITLFMFFITLASIFYLDEMAIQWAMDLPMTVFTEILRLFALYINPYSVAFFTVLLLTYRFYELRKNGQYPYDDRLSIHLIGILLALIFALILKISIGRTRPEVLFTENMPGFFGFQTDRLFHSMPSGHATVVSAGLMVVWYHQYSWLTRVLFFAVAAIILAGRVVLGEHYPSDLITGIWLGFIIVYWADLYYKSTRYSAPP